MPSLRYQRRTIPTFKKSAIDGVSRLLAQPFEYRLSERGVPRQAAGVCADLYEVGDRCRLTRDLPQRPREIDDAIPAAERLQHDLLQLVLAGW